MDSQVLQSLRTIRRERLELEDLGRPKEIAEVKALARKQTTIAINTLVAIAQSSKATDAARVSACVALLDRGWGKPDKTHHHDGRHSSAHHIRQATDSR